MLHSDEYIQSLCPSLGLEIDALSFQFLWLVPVVEMLWADGRCQREEVRVLLHYADRFVNLASREVPGITRERVRQFLRPLLDPSVGRNPRKRAELTRLSDFILQERVAPAHRDRRKHLFDICVEVAAAANADEPERLDRRISVREERLLSQLLKELQLDK
jgi:hypothetical protein